MRLPFLLVMAGALAACAPVEKETALTFQQRQKQCFDQTVAGVQLRPGEEVKAAIGPDGGFRGGIFKGGFLRGNVDSAPYDACMAGQMAEMARGDAKKVADGVYLTPDEKLTWDQMTPEERERVRLFMINGGTFASALGSDT